MLPHSRALRRREDRANLHLQVCAHHAPSLQMMPPLCCPSHSHVSSLCHLGNVATTRASLLTQTSAASVAALLQSWQTQAEQPGASFAAQRKKQWPVLPL